MFDTCRLMPLRQVLVERYSAEELKDLYFALGVPYDNLPGQDLPAKTRELLVYLNHRDGIPDLIRAARAQRPDIPWDDVTRRIESPLACLGPRRCQVAAVAASCVALLAALALLALALTAGSGRLGSTPTPPAAFLYQVQVLEGQTGAPVRDAKVSVKVGGAPPKDEVTGDNGVAVFSVDGADNGQLAKLIVEANGFQPLTRTVELAPTSPQRVQLSPAP